MGGCEGCEGWEVNDDRNDRWKPGGKGRESTEGRR